jgi:Dynamin family
VSDAPASADLVDVLVRLRETLVGHELPFEAADAPPARAERDHLVKQLDDYIIPRLQQIDAPLLAVVGGSTGAGKSTLVNAIVGSPVSVTGVLRPTTRSPVLVHNPADAHWFNADRLLPDLERTDRATGDQGAVQLVATDRLPSGLAILDAPDVDSVEERNRALASQLLAAADLWLFVTSAARYADQVPWGFLKAAAERSTQVAVVLDRTTPGALREVSSHLAHMMTERGLGDSPLFTVPESPVDEHGMLPEAAVAPIRRWLDSLAADEAARGEVVRKTLSGAVASLGARTRTVASALASQEQIAARLRADALGAYADSLASVDEATQDGSLLRGEVMARWQEFVGTGELLRGLESRVGRLRDRLWSVASGRPMPAQDVTVAVESGLETLIVEHAESAAERAALAWRTLPAGAALLSSAPGDIGRASRDLRATAERSVRDWQGAVLDLVRTEGSDRRATARVLAYGVNGLGVALMIVIFAQTAGVTGAEVGVAGGTAVIGQKVLEAVFGDQAVRELAEAAHADLHTRVEELMDRECQRYLDVLEKTAVTPGAGKQLLDVVRDLDVARWTGVQQ